MRDRAPICRIVKPFGNSVLGVDFGNHLKEGVVYEIRSLGEDLGFIVREVGVSTICQRGGNIHGNLFGEDLNTLVLDGRHLLTDEELLKLNEQNLK